VWFHVFIFLESRWYCGKKVKFKRVSARATKIESTWQACVSKYAQQRSFFDARSWWHRNARLTFMFRSAIWFIQKVTEYHDSRSWSATTEVNFGLKNYVFSLFLTRVSVYILHLFNLSLRLLKMRKPIREFLKIKNTLYVVKPRTSTPSYVRLEYRQISVKM
jgi:hypothetical protein